MTAIFDNLPGELDIEGVVGNDVEMDVAFQDTNLTGYTFSGFVILEPPPLQKTYALTITNTNLALGLIQVSLSDANTTEIGPVSGKPWYVSWNNGGDIRNVLRGHLRLDRR